MSSPDRLRVGFLAPGWSPDRGGVEVHAALLARELLARRHAVLVLALDRSARLSAYATEDAVVAGVRVRRMGPGWGGGDSLAGLVYDARAEEVLRAWLDETRPDLVHVHHLTGFGAGALDVLAERVPVVLTLHDYWLACPRGQLVRDDGVVCTRPEPAVCGSCLGTTWPHLVPTGGGAAAGPAGESLANDAEAAEARTRFALAALATLASNERARVVVPSAGARDAWSAIGADTARFEVLEPGIEAGWIAAETARLRRESPGARAGLALGCLGSVQPSKGVLELARTFSALDGDDRRLEIWGPVEPYHGDASYVARLRELCLRDHRVELRGTYEPARLPALLARLDGVAVPSRWPEVFGIGAREARAAGLPLLVSDVGGLRDVLVHDEGGLRIAPDDAAAWRNALERFFTDKTSRTRWASAATRVPESLATARALEELYRACLAPRASSPCGSTDP